MQINRQSISTKLGGIIYFTLKKCLFVKWGIKQSSQKLTTLKFDEIYHNIYVSKW